MALDKDGKEIVDGEPTFPTVDVEDEQNINTDFAKDLQAKVDAQLEEKKKRGRPAKKAAEGETDEQKTAREAKEKEIADAEAKRISDANAESAKKTKDGKVINIDGSKPDNEDEETELSEEDKVIAAQLKQFEDYKDEPVVTKTVSEDGKKNDDAVVVETEEVKVYKTKASKYDELENDPYVKAIFAFKESGKDISELPSFLGIKTVAKLTSFKNPTDADLSVIEDLIKSDVAKMGLPSGDIEEAVQEQMEKFNDMDTMQRKAFYDSKVASVIKESEETLKNFKSISKPDYLVEVNGLKVDSRLYAEPERVKDVIENSIIDIDTALAEKIKNKTTVGFVEVSQAVLDKIRPVVFEIIDRSGVVKDKNGKIKGYKLTDEIFEEAVMRKYHKLNTQLALQGQKKLLEKKWLEEHNTVDGGQQRASRMTTSKTKTATDVLQETGKIEFEDAQVG